MPVYLYLALVLLTPTVLQAAVPVLHATANEAPCHSRLDIDIDWAAAYTNAFDPAEVRVKLDVTHESGALYNVPAFFLQNYESGRFTPGQAAAWLYPVGKPRWQARFAPLREGKHQAVAHVRDARGEHLSKPIEFTATSAKSPGYVRVSRSDPRFLELQPSSADRPARPFFPIGQNLAFIGLNQYVSLDRSEDIFQKLSANGANYLRIWVCCEDWATAIEARKSAFARSWAGRPPIVPCPDDPAHKCLRLSPTNRTVRVEPSHRVALKPDKAYRMSGRWRSAEAGLEIEARGKRLELQNGSTDWKPFALEFTTGENERWLGSVAIALRDQGEAWVKELSLKEAAGGPELLWEADLDRPVLGYYNQPDCFMVDELVRSAQQHGIYLQLCVLTRDLYMNRLKNPSSSEYSEAIANAKNFMRYAVARWGYSTAVASWEYWNEMDPSKPTERFYRELAQFLDSIDIYRHLRSTSTWGPSARDCKEPALDMADTHFYLRPADESRLEDEVHAIIDRAAWLRQNAPGKPAILGEFGLADDKWRITPEMNSRRGLADVHHALWASALSGLSGTALPWWWERMDQQNVYPLYRPVSHFVKEIPWTTGKIEQKEISCTRTNFRVLALGGGSQVWGWIFDKTSSWKDHADLMSPPTVQPVALELAGVRPGRFTVEWFDTRKGEYVRKNVRQVTAQVLKFETPEFRGDIAFRLTPAE